MKLKKLKQFFHFLFSYCQAFSGIRSCSSFYIKQTRRCRPVRWACTEISQCDSFVVDCSNKDIFLLSFSETKIVIQWNPMFITIQLQNDFLKIFHKPQITRSHMIKSYTSSRSFISSSHHHSENGYRQTERQITSEVWSYTV